jgi:hypothetical protein
MGARAQVLIEDDGVYLYTHWGAGSIEDDVLKALKSDAGQGRLNDSEYLARIIFEVMIGDERGTETGFGIGTTQHGDIEKLITVNCGQGLVTVHDMYGDDQTDYSYNFNQLEDK